MNTYLYLFNIYENVEKLNHKILKYILYYTMSKIQTEKEYNNIIVKILDDIYNLSNEENEKIIGVKNKEQPYGLKIKDILDKYCIETIKKKIIKMLILKIMKI